VPEAGGREDGDERLEARPAAGVHEPAQPVGVRDGRRDARDLRPLGAVGGVAEHLAARLRLAECAVDQRVEQLDALRRHARRDSWAYRSSMSSVLTRISGMSAMTLPAAFLAPDARIRLTSRAYRCAGVVRQRGAAGEVGVEVVRQRHERRVDAGVRRLDRGVAELRGTPSRRRAPGSGSTRTSGGRPGASSAPPSGPRRRASGASSRRPCPVGSHPRRACYAAGPCGSAPRATPRGRGAGSGSRCRRGPTAGRRAGGSPGTSRSGSRRAATPPPRRSARAARRPGAVHGRPPDSIQRRTSSARFDAPSFSRARSRDRRRPGVR
jgi:hypothetical protein